MGKVEMGAMGVQSFFDKTEYARQLK